MTVHRYATRANWEGSTGGGWEAYDRAHEVTAAPAAQVLTVTTGERHGDPALLNPEQLVVAAASSCQLLWFLHLAAKARVDVLAYEDRAEGIMPEDDRPVRITEIVLRPRIMVAAGSSSEERVRHLCELAHRECYVANSLRGDVRVEPEVVFRDAVAG
jgi:organic hydroperoxide reductase OsmC/OhrA